MLEQAAPEGLSAQAAQTAAGGRWKTRILQSKGRRYALRLETEFWDVLAALAEERHQRLNLLVAELAEHAGASGTLTSGIRSFCLSELRRRIRRRSTAAERTSIIDLVLSALAPGLLLDAAGKIIAANEALLRWLSLPAGALAEEPFARQFRARDPVAFDQVLNGESPAQPRRMRFIHTSPGRVLTVTGVAVPILLARNARLCLVWLSA